MDEATKQRVRDCFKGSDTAQAQAEAWIAKFEAEEEGKTRCEYPMSDYYTYQEDVPPNTRVSTPEDCQNCNGLEDGEGENCCEEMGHCLMTENPDEEKEYEKKCEGCCPKCGSNNIDWGISESVSDEWYHQRGSCNNCEHCFTEVSEMVYRSTLVKGD